MAAADISVVAVVQFNKGEALVLNRPLQFVYERRGMDYIGQDGPFKRLLGYSRGSGRFVAFAGATVSVRMADGTIHHLKDHWWSGHEPGSVHATYGDVDSLKKCYVYGGACIMPDDYAALRESYAGCVYPYWDYEKVIKYDDQRRSLLNRVFHEERRRKALTAAIKAKHRELIAMRGEA